MVVAEEEEEEAPHSQPVLMTVARRQLLSLLQVMAETLAMVTQGDGGGN